MFILDVVGPIADQAAQTNYNTALTCVIQFVRMDWCVRGATTSNYNYSMLIYFHGQIFLTSYSQCP